FALARQRADGVREVAEFFVVRSHRYAGVGRAAALALFGRMPGEWEVFHDDANTAAGTFWASVIGEAGPGGYQLEPVTTSAGFVGQRYRFRSDPLVAAESSPGATGEHEPVEIAEYDPSWPSMFAEEAAKIATALGDQLLGIEHIGSTAVEGLAAKPMIDIQVGVRSLRATPRIVEALGRLGYDYVPEFEAELPNRRYFRKTAGGRRTHQVHLVERTDTDWWDRHVAFRDWLRTHPEDAATYAALKAELAKAHRDDRHAYTDAKSEFIEKIAKRARTAAPPN
ncbi:MAG: GrpB family protein, partial [Mycobacteriales bacterium]